LYIRSKSRSVYNTLAILFDYICSFLFLDEKKRTKEKSRKKYASTRSWPFQEKLQKLASLFCVFLKNSQFTPALARIFFWLALGKE
jgi:hypothetical protein